MGAKYELVVTDVAAKGLDFPNIEHVINYDMPKDIQSYVHRIGRTGRGENTSTATTLVSSSDSPNVLTDLVQLMVEAKQFVPEALYERVPDIKLVKPDGLETHSSWLQSLDRRECRRRIAAGSDSALEPPTRSPSVSGSVFDEIELPLEGNVCCF